MKKGIIIAILFCSIIICSRIKASTWENVWIPPTVQYQINGGTWNNASVSSDNFHTIYSVNTTAKYRFKFTSQRELTSADEALYFNIKFQMTDVAQQNVDIEQDNTFTCITAYSQQSGGTTYTGFTCTGMDFDQHPSTYSLQVSYRYNVNGTVYYKSCLAYSNAGINYTFKCPVTSNAIDGVEVSVAGSNMGNFNIGLFYLYNIEKSDTQAIIDNQNNNTQQIIESNTTYDQNATESFTNETQEINDYEQAEANLLNNLDFSAVNETISINPNASQFIWNIVEGLRSMNGAIILLMSSIFSIGLIKLVLNR